MTATKTPTPKSASTESSKNEIFELTQGFYFEAAHTLKTLTDTASSSRIHGHTYLAYVTLRGPQNPNTGMVMDLGQLREQIERVRALLDHRFLDEVHEIGPVTLENLCKFIKDELLPGIPLIYKVCVERKASADKCTLYA
jgi:6-pyruvoyltetrahydropterin/6-carboxytetrahydropterin synthase